MRENRWPGLIRPVLVALVLIVGIAEPAIRAQEGLYGAAAPADAAFVRVVNAQAQPLPELWVGATRFAALAPQTASPYRPVNPGIHQVFLGTRSEELIPRRGVYYTVMVTRDGLFIVEDTAHTRPDRAQIVLYHFAGGSALSVRTADGTATVIGDVRTGSSGTVQVNAVAVELALFRDGEQLAALGDLGLARGQSYSIIAFPQAAGGPTGTDGVGVLVEQARLSQE